MLIVFSCRRENLAGSGPVQFSEDTISFDTLFTTFQSPTQRLQFYNTSRGKLKLESISILGGGGSDFSIIVDGVESQSVSDYELNSGDSAIIFIKLRSVEKDKFSRDYLQFVSGNSVQVVVLQAFLLDAFFWKDYVVWDGEDLNFDNSKPHVIDGIFRVMPGAMLTIAPGTQLYFTSRKDENFNLISMLDIQGTLLVDGMPGSPVVFTSSRLDGDYPETGAQWRGIRFGTNSRLSKIEYALIKNALFGIEVDSFSIDMNPKVRIRQTEIRNMSAYGLWGIGYGIPTPNHGPMIDAQNVLIHNCQQANFAMIAGGDAVLNNCTFANYSIDFSRRSAQLGISNYYEDTASTTLYPAIVQFNNCIIWGSEEEEIVLDTIEGYPGYLFVEFNSCILKTTKDFAGTNILKNADPLFTDPTKVNPFERDYSLKENSPAINSGINLSGPPFHLYVDFKGVPRGAQYDRGCFEFVP